MRLDRIIAISNTHTVYRDGDLCVKVFHGDVSPADVLEEASRQTRAAEAGLCVPAVRGVVQVDGEWTILTDFMEGVTLARQLSGHPDGEEAFLNVLTDVMLRVHAAACPALPDLRSRLISDIAASPLPAARRAALSAFVASQPEGEGICHGDLSPSHVILTGEGEPCVLDWKSAARGDRLADVAATFLSLSRTDPARAARCLTLYSMKCGIDPDAVRAWIPAVAASRMPHSNAEGRAFLQQTLDQYL